MMKTFVISFGFPGTIIKSTKVEAETWKEAALIAIPGYFPGTLDDDDLIQMSKDINSLSDDIDTALEEFVDFSGGDGALGVIEI